MFNFESRNKTEGNHKESLDQKVQFKYLAKGQKELNLHHRYVHPEEIAKEKKRFCKSCSYESLTKNDMLSHEEIIHGAVILTCKYCKYKSSRKSHYDRHVKAIHEPDWYACEFCEFKTRHKQNMKQHVITMHKQNVDDLELKRLILNITISSS